MFVWTGICVNLIYKLKNIFGKTDFSEQFKNIVHSLQKDWLQNGYSAANL